MCCLCGHARARNKALSRTALAEHHPGSELGFGCCGIQNGLQLHGQPAWGRGVVHKDALGMAASLTPTLQPFLAAAAFWVPAHPTVNSQSHSLSLSVHRNAAADGTGKWGWAGSKLRARAQAWAGERCAPRPPPSPHGALDLELAHEEGLLRPQLAHHQLGKVVVCGEGGAGEGRGLGSALALPRLRACLAPRLRHSWPPSRPNS